MTRWCLFTPAVCRPCSRSRTRLFGVSSNQLHPNAPAFASGRVTSGEPVYWRLQPDWGKPVALSSVHGGVEVERVQCRVGGLLAGGGIPTPSPNGRSRFCHRPFARQSI